MTQLLKSKYCIAWLLVDFSRIFCVFFFGENPVNHMHLLIECFNRCANIKFHFFFTQICLIYFYTSILSPSVYFAFFFFEKSSIFFIVYIRFSLVQFSFWIQQSWIICNRNEKRKKNQQNHIQILHEVSEVLQMNNMKYETNYEPLKNLINLKYLVTMASFRRFSFIMNSFCKNDIMINKIALNLTETISLNWSS